ncbi:MAG: MFS transporter [Acidimicrobiales bacterium]|nr:MFS transporter [Acidimicrobiales bacterium]
MVEQRPRIPLSVLALLGIYFLSTLAVVGQVTIVGKQVFDLTGRELDLGLLGLAEFLPTALLSPITGSLADRYDRRHILAIGLLGEAAASVLLFLYARTDPTAVLPIFGIVALFGVARAFVAPSLRALPVDLAPPLIVERVVALVAVSWQTGAIVGPVVFGFAYVAGISLPYLIAAVAFLGGLVLLALVPAPRLERSTAAPGVGAAVRHASEGLRFIRRTPIVFGAVSLDLFAVLFGGAVALLPAIAEERLGVGAVGLGWLRAAIGIGAASTGLLLTIRPIARRVGRVLLVSVGVFGVATIVLGVTRSYWVAVVALLVLAGADAVSVYIRATLVPLATPESMRGRVLAVENVFIGASNELGAFESGVAGHLLGLVGAVVSGGIGTLAVVGVWWKLFPALRDVDRFAEVRPAATPPR